MSVLHGICCVTGCLNWKPAHNISTRCQSSDYPLVSANTHTGTHTLFWPFFVIVLSLALCFFCFSVTHWCPLFCLPTSVNTQRQTHTHAHNHTHTQTYRHHVMSFMMLCDRQVDSRQQSWLTVSVLSLFFFPLLILSSVHSLFSSEWVLTDTVWHFHSGIIIYCPECAYHKAAALKWPDAVCGLFSRE